MGRWPRGLMSAALGLGVALCAGLGLGCLLELDHPISCGDGYIDVVAGEKCDPLADYDRNGCRELGLGNADAQCDPETCTLLLSEDDCHQCGDGKATGPELCDGSDFQPGVECPSGAGQIRCNDDCTPDLALCDSCGDGQVDEPEEECDPNRRCETQQDCEQGLVCDPESLRCVGQGGILPVTQCFDLELTASGLVIPKGDYTQGVVTQDNCTSECAFDRSSCSFCGDGELDQGYDDLGPTGAFQAQPQEVCDGDAKDPTAFGNFCKLQCFENPENVGYDVACVQASCNDKCSGFEFVDPTPPPNPDPVEDLGCCLKAAESCAGNPPFPCCWELEHGGEDDGCDPVFLGNQIVDMRCRSD